MIAAEVAAALNQCAEMKRGESRQRSGGSRMIPYHLAR
jgi:hypothetical protein